MKPTLARLTALFVGICLAPAALAQASASASSRRADPRDVDRVVAIVNTDVITANELAMRQRTVAAQLRRQRIEVPPDDLLARQVLERLVMDRALAQAARDQGLRIDDAQLDRTVARIAEDSKTTPAGLRSRVESDGMSYQRFREDLRDELLIGRFREREVDARIQISEADIDAFLAERAAQGSEMAPEINLGQILLRVPEGASSDQIERQRLRGEEIIRQLQKGADFARLAAAFSDAPDAMSGGALGLRSVERLPELFVEATLKLRKGETAPLVRSPNGFHVLQVLDRQDHGHLPFSGGPVTQTRVRHILIRPTDLVPEAEAQRRLRLIRDRLGSGQVEFADMARQYSADGTASRGGELGWLYPGDTVPDFERAMNALEPGQISDIVRTEFGFHLIEVLERRRDQASPERVRAAARQALRERRLDDAVQDWMRQLRDRAYVEFKER